MLKSLSSEDAGTLAAIEVKAQSSPWTASQCLESLQSGATGLGVWQDDQYCGFLLHRIILDESELLTLSVLPDYQGQGLGTALMCNYLTGLSASGVQKAFLEVRASNLVAQQLYEKHGFSQTGRRLGYYPVVAGREDAIIMTLQL